MNKNKSKMDVDLVADELVESADEIKGIAKSTIDLIETSNKKYTEERGYKTSQIQLDTDDEESELSLNEIEDKDELGDQEMQDDGESVIKLVQTSVDEAIKSENNSHIMKKSSHEDSTKEFGNELIEVSDTKFIEDAEAVTNLALSSSKKTDSEILAEQQSTQQDESEFSEADSEAGDNQNLIETSDALINLTFNSAKENESSKTLTKLEEQDNDLRTDELVQVSDTDNIKGLDEMAMNLQIKEENLIKANFMTNEMSKVELEELVGRN